MIAETRGSIFRLHSRCCRRRLFLSSLVKISRRRRRFADYVKTSPKSMLHVRHDYFSSFNQSNHCFLSLSLPLQFYRRLIRLYRSRGGNTAL